MHISRNQTNAPPKFCESSCVSFQWRIYDLQKGGEEAKMLLKGMMFLLYVGYPWSRAPLQFFVPPKGFLMRIWWISRKNLERVDCCLLPTKEEVSINIFNQV